MVIGACGVFGYHVSFTRTRYPVRFRAGAKKFLFAHPRCYFLCLMFASVRAKFQESISDDIIAIFLSESGELVTETFHGVVDIYFTEPKLTSFFGLEYKKCLNWWYISDCFHCGKRLKEDYYRPIMGESDNGEIEQTNYKNVCCALGEDDAMEEDKQIDNNRTIVDENAIEIRQIGEPILNKENIEPEVQNKINSERSHINEVGTADHLAPRLGFSKVNTGKNKEDRQIFYLNPGDECISLLKSKLRSQNILVIDELPSENSQISSENIIIISYRLHPYLSKYPQAYTPFYLARIMDLEENRGKALLEMPQTEFHILDRPCPVGPIEPKLEISISGFVGQQRTIVQLMIQLSGSRYNDHLSPAIDILIIPVRSNSADEPIKPTKKEEAANVWKIPIVDLNWLEASFKNWYWTKNK